MFRLSLLPPNTPKVLVYNFKHKKYSNKKDLDIVNLFFDLMKKNLSPESFCVRTKDFNIISCSPENLFKVRGKKIVTSPIAGTVSRDKIKSTKEARRFFENNQKPCLELR